MSGRLDYGPHSVSRDFEEAFSHHHSRRYGLALNSGTSALLAAYFGCGIGQTGTPHRRTGAPPEVIVPAYGFFATVSPLLHLGAKPVFCDVQEDTGNIDPDVASQLINRRTVAIVVTHIAGHPGELDRLVRLARAHGLHLIEDCSHAHGATFGGRLVGTFGTVAAWSLQTGKMVSAGEGGVVLTDSRRVFARAAALGNFRRLEGTDVPLPAKLRGTGLGLKLRISPLSAAMAAYFTQALPALISARTRRMNYLTALLDDAPENFMRPPVTRPNTTRGAFYEYGLRVPRDVLRRVPRCALESALAAEGVAVRASNTRALHQLPLFRHGLGPRRALPKRRDRRTGSRVRAPTAERLERETLFIETLTQEPLELVREYATAIVKVCKDLGSIERAWRRGALTPHLRG